jgi:hypothetical protein
MAEIILLTYYSYKLLDLFERKCRLHLQSSGLIFRMMNRFGYMGRVQRP